MRRTLLVLGMVAMWAAAAFVPARADAGHPGSFTERIAAERDARGLGRLERAADLDAVAQQHASRMAERGEPYHNPSLADEVTGWEVVGENVGRGPDVDQIHSAFMASDTHREQILFPGYTEVGLGVVEADGQLWVVEVFRQPLGEQAAVTSAAPAALASIAPLSPRTAAPTLEAPAAVASPAEPTARRAAVIVDVRDADRSVAWSASPALVPVSTAVDAARAVPVPVAVATGLLAAVVGAQAAAVRRLGLA